MTKCGKSHTNISVNTKHTWGNLKAPLVSSCIETGFVGMIYKDCL